jgi:hypothetical protein
MDVRTVFLKCEVVVVVIHDELVARIQYSIRLSRLRLSVWIHVIGISLSVLFCVVADFCIHAINLHQRVYLFSFPHPTPSALVKNSFDLHVT